MKQPFSSPGFLWPLLTLLCLLAILFGFKTVLKRTGWEKPEKRKIVLVTSAVIIIWLALITRLSIAGFFSDFTRLPPRLLIAILFPLPVALMISFSNKGTRLLTLVPTQWLVFIQCFRAFVELLIWFAFLAGKLPVQMSIEGRNFDLLTAILAFPVGYLLLRRTAYSRQIALAFNIVGLLLLLNVLIVTMVSMPVPWRWFKNEPSAALLGSIPLVLLPSILVPIAYTLHIFSIRQYLIYKKSIAQ